MDQVSIYIGNRYVPKIEGEWDQLKEYEGLSIVTLNGSSYTFKKIVPEGVSLSNEEYWVKTGDSNADSSTSQEIIDARKDGNGVTYNALYDRLIALEMEMVNMSVGKKQIYVESSNGSLAMGAEVSVIDTTKPCIIDFITLGTSDKDNGQIRLLPYVDGVKKPIGEVSTRGLSPQPMTPAMLNSFGTEIFNTLVYDISGNNYKYSLSRQMYFPNGLQIILKNRSTTSAITIGAVVIGREMK